MDSIRDSVRMGTRVFIGRLPQDIREKDVDRFFKNYRVRDILLKNGYGFIEMDDRRDAEDAVHEMNGKELLGERIVVEHAKGPNNRRRDSDWDRGYGGSSGRDGGSSGRDGGGGYGGTRRYDLPLRTEYRVLVENLSSRVTWQDLKDYMRQAGEVTFADAHKLRQGEGHVEFASERDMRKAIDEFQGRELNGRAIKLKEDERNPSRRSRSRSNSRSRSRDSRSRSRSKSRSKSRSRSKSKSRSVSRSKNRSRSRSRSK